MAASDTARALAAPMGDLGGRFMLSERTYVTGAGFGFSGLDFYFCGRGGVLGAVDASVVSDELGFFEPEGVRRQWEAGLAVMDPTETAAKFIDCGYSWGRARLPGDLPAGRLAELTRAVVDATGDEQPALFAGWRAMPWPEDDPARALHAIHLWRELRGGLHVRAVHDAGIEPHTAVVVNTGEGGAEFFAWSAPHPDPEPHRQAWAAAEEATNDAVAAAVAVLDEEDQAELVALALASVPRAT